MSEHEDNAPRKVGWTVPRWVYDRVAVRAQLEGRSMSYTVARLLVMALKSLEHSAARQDSD